MSLKSAQKSVPSSSFVPVEQSELSVLCSLDTLNRYIQSQQSLLDRINSSLSYFHELDETAVEDPHGVFDHISDPTHDEAGVLEKIENLVGDIFGEDGKEAVASIDWDVFPGDRGASAIGCSVERVL